MIVVNDRGDDTLLSQIDKPASTVVARMNKPVDYLAIICYLGRYSAH